jgi:hypothetical protein
VIVFEFAFDKIIRKAIVSKSGHKQLINWQMHKKQKTKTKKQKNKKKQKTKNKKKQYQYFN